MLSKHHPVLRYANPQEWLQILEKVEALGVETIVPGHGEVGALHELHQVRAYLVDLLSLVGELVKNGEPIDGIPVPEAYRGWYFTRDFQTNLKRVYDLLTGKA